MHAQLHICNQSHCIKSQYFIWNLVTDMHAYNSARLHSLMHTLGTHINTYMHYVQTCKYFIYTCMHRNTYTTSHPYSLHQITIYQIANMHAFYTHIHTSHACNTCTHVYMSSHNITLWHFLALHHMTPLHKINLHNTHACMHACTHACRHTFHTCIHNCIARHHITLHYIACMKYMHHIHVLHTHKHTFIHICISCMHTLNARIQCIHTHMHTHKHYMHTCVHRMHTNIVCITCPYTRMHATHTLHTHIHRMLTLHTCMHIGMQYSHII